MARILWLPLCAAGIAWAAVAWTETLSQTDLFVSGEGGYHTYRIPALALTREGTALAFCEGRRDGGGDSGQIDLLLRRSVDGGATWGPIQVVSSAKGYTTGNPAPVVDRATGVIVLLLTRNRDEDKEPVILRGDAPPRTVWITRSRDDGLTWEEPQDISASTRREEWRWYATGPCHGIQTASGRLIIPCDHSRSPAHQDWHSHVIYSDDGGAAWHIGGIAEGFTNESTVVELVDGRLCLNMRNYRDTKRRAVAFSEDQGMNWSPVRDDDALVEPRCQASIIRYTTEADGEKNRVLFSNPASDKRENMTVRVSYDECETWPAGRSLHAGPAAYSDLVVLPSRNIGCLYERGEKNPYERITFANFSLQWLTEGADAP